MKQSYKFNGLFDTLVNAGLQIFGTVQAQQQQSGGGASGQAKGLAAIRAAGNQLIAAFDQLLIAYAALPLNQRLQTATDVLRQGQELRNALDNPQYFFQARSGNDAAELRGLKQTADIKLAQLQGFVREAQTGVINAPTNNAPVNTNTGSNTSINTGNTPTNSNNPDIIYMQNPVGNEETKDNTLLYVGLGVVALLLLKK